MILWLALLQFCRKHYINVYPNSVNPTQAKVVHLLILIPISVVISQIIPKLLS